MDSNSAALLPQAAPASPAPSGDDAFPFFNHRRANIAWNAFLILMVMLFIMLWSFRSTSQLTLYGYGFVFFTTYLIFTAVFIIWERCTCYSTTCKRHSATTASLVAILALFAFLIWVPITCQQYDTWQLVWSDSDSQQNHVPKAYMNVFECPSATLVLNGVDQEDFTIQTRSWAFQTFAFDVVPNSMQNSSTPITSNTTECTIICGGIHANRICPPILWSGQATNENDDFSLQQTNGLVLLKQLPIPAFVLTIAMMFYLGCEVRYIFRRAASAAGAAGDDHSHHAQSAELV